MRGSFIFSVIDFFLLLSADPFSSFPFLSLRSVSPFAGPKEGRGGLKGKRRRRRRRQRHGRIGSRGNGGRRRKGLRYTCLGRSQTTEKGKGKGKGRCTHCLEKSFESGGEMMISEEEESGSGGASRISSARIYFQRRIFCIRSVRGGGGK